MLPDLSKIKVLNDAIERPLHIHITFLFQGFLIVERGLDRTFLNLKALYDVITIFGCMFP